MATRIISHAFENLQPRFGAAFSRRVKKPGIFMRQSADHYPVDLLQVRANRGIRLDAAVDLEQTAGHALFELIHNIVLQRGNLTVLFWRERGWQRGNLWLGRQQRCG